MKKSTKIIVSIVAILAILGIAKLVSAAGVNGVLGLKNEPSPAIISDVSVVTKVDASTVKVVQTKMIQKTAYVAGLNNQIKMEQDQITALQAKIASQQALINSVK